MTVIVVKKDGQLEATVNDQIAKKVSTFANKFAFQPDQPVKNQPLSTKKTLLHKILPRSGEKNSGILVLLGILLLGVILIVFKKRQTRNK